MLSSGLGKLTMSCWPVSLLCLSSVPAVQDRSLQCKGGTVGALMYRYHASQCLWCLHVNVCALQCKMKNCKSLAKSQSYCVHSQWPSLTAGQIVESTSPDSCCRVVFCYHIVAICVALCCIARCVVLSHSCASLQSLCIPPTKATTTSKKLLPVCNCCQHWISLFRYD